MSISAIVLAAGASRRLGRPKQLVDFLGKPLLRRTVLTILTGCRDIVVVLGFQADKVGASLTGLPVRVVINTEWQTGIASSIRTGVMALPSDAEGTLLFVCDQIALDSILVMRLLEVQSSHSDSVVACEYDGIRGIPAYFPVKYFPTLKALTGDHGAGQFLQSNAVLTVSFPNGGYDIDCQKDMLKILKV
jgi:molybdenum cofactor cytidylyltransferase